MEFIGIIVIAILIYLYVMMKKPGGNIEQISTNELKLLFSNSLMFVRRENSDKITSDNLRICHYSLYNKTITNYLRIKKSL